MTPIPRRLPIPGGSMRACRRNVRNARRRPNLVLNPVPGLVRVSPRTPSQTAQRPAFGAGNPPHAGAHGGKSATAASAFRGTRFRILAPSAAGLAFCRAGAQGARAPPRRRFLHRRVRPNFCAARSSRDPSRKPHGNKPCGKIVRRIRSVPPGAVCSRASICKKVTAGRRVVNGVSLNVSRGEAVGLLGPNGAARPPCSIW